MSAPDFIARGLAASAIKERPALLAALEERSFPDLAMRVVSSGRTDHGRGSAQYISDSMASPDLAQAHPRFCFADKRGRHFRLVPGPDGLISAAQAGALADGVSEDTAAIQSALDYAGEISARGVVVEHGVHMIDRITVPAGLTICGEGTLRSKDSASNGACIDLLEGACAKDLTIDGNRANQALDTAGLRLSGDRSSAINVTIVGTRLYGIDVVNCDEVSLIDCHVSDTANAGIMVRAPSQDMSDILVLGCTVDRSMVDGATLIEAAIKSAATNGNTIRRLRVNGCTAKQPVQPTSGVGICIELWGGNEDCSVSGCNTHGGLMGISLNASAGGCISGNTVRAADAYGIEMALTRYVSCTGNSVDGEGILDHGIAVTAQSIGQSSNNAVVGNTICNAVRGIKLFKSTDTLISENIGDGISLVWFNPQSAIRYSFLGNRATANGATLGCYLDSSGHGHIAENTFIGFSGSAIQLYSGAAYDFEQLVIEGNRYIDCAKSYQQVGQAAIGSGSIWRGNLTNFGNADIVTDRTTGLTLSHWMNEVQITPTSDQTVVLPTGVARGQRHTIRKLGQTSAARITVQAQSGTISGRPAIAIDSGENGVAVEWNGSAWVVDGGLPPIHSTLAAYDAPIIGGGASETFSIAVPGASPGDQVRVSFSVALAGLIAFAEVSAADSVAVTLHNPTGSSIDLGVCDVRVEVDQ